MSTIKPPIFVVDRQGVDIGVYSAVENVECHLEAIDVKNDEYVVYDAEGRLLTLGVEKRKTLIFFGLFKVDAEYVVVEAVEETPNHKEELRLALISYLEAEKVPHPFLQNASFDELIKKAQSIFDVGGGEVTVRNNR